VRPLYDGQYFAAERTPPADASGLAPPAAAEQAAQAEQGGARLEGGRSAGDEISGIKLEGGRSAGAGRSADALEEECNLGLAEEVQRRFCLALEPLLALPGGDN
jgi:hypothetical protein